jgi:hypothetical protein
MTTALFRQLTFPKRANIGKKGAMVLGVLMFSGCTFVQRKSKEPVWQPPAPDVEPLGDGTPLPSPKPTLFPSNKPTTATPDSEVVPLPKALFPKALFPNALLGKWRHDRVACMRASLGGTGLAAHNAALSERVETYEFAESASQKIVSTVWRVDSKETGCVFTFPLAVTFPLSTRMTLSEKDPKIDRLGGLPAEACTASAGGTRENLRFEIASNEWILALPWDAQFQELCTSGDVLFIHTRQP